MQVLIGLPPQINHNALADIRERVALKIIEDRADEKRGDEKGSDAIELIAVALSENAIHQRLHNPWKDQAQPRADDEGNDRDEHITAIRREIREESFDLIAGGSDEFLWFGGALRARGTGEEHGEANLLPLSLLI